MQANKRKIINDPVYGFVSIPFDLVYDIIQHPYFQRLRRIKQLGLANLIYPGAEHTRFHHSIGAMHLMTRALDILKFKGHEITDQETEAAVIAILLHDIGHGPFSHSLEYSIIGNVHHEQLSLLFLEYFNKATHGRLNLAIRIFNGTYHKQFLHDLVSSQLDVDRLDYLNRDSFFTGVSEGVIGYDRIIEMLDVVDNRLVVEEKGIYSIEKFIVARRLMYWQVYLHKTSICAEELLNKVLHRARFLIQQGVDILCSDELHYFMTNEVTLEDFNTNAKLLDTFASLDDNDIVFALKSWKKNDDVILSHFAHCLLNRKLFKVEFVKTSNIETRYNELKQLFEENEISHDLTNAFIIQGEVTNNAYKNIDEEIIIKFKDGSTKSIVKSSEHLNLKALSKPVTKHYICYPKNIKVIKELSE